MLPIDDAFKRVDQHVKPLASVDTPILSALNHCLSSDQHSLIDLPPFPQSAVDGYAVAYDDLAQGPLPVAGEIPAGAMSFTPVHQPGTAVRIFTGGFVPTGADTVIRQEYAAINHGQLSLTETVDRGADMRQQGEEVQKGTLLAKAGSLLTPGLIGSLSNSGIDRVTVAQAPRVRILITGNEVVPPGQTLQPGQVYDANGATCLNFFKAQGIEDVAVSWVQDDANTVQRAMQQALAECDLLITTGGVSVGDYDYIPSSCDALGATTVFHKVAQKPGMPLLFAELNSQYILGLPGNPAAVAVNLNLYGKRILDRLAGLPKPGPHWHAAVLADPVRADSRRDRWVRMHQKVTDKGQLSLHRLQHQASHMLTNMNEANALIRVHAGQDLAAGDIVAWCKAC